MNTLIINTLIINYSAIAANSNSIKTIINPIIAYVNSISLNFSLITKRANRPTSSDLSNNDHFYFYYHPLEKSLTSNSTIIGEVAGSLPCTFQKLFVFHLYDAIIHSCLQQLLI